MENEALRFIEIMYSEQAPLQAPEDAP